MIRAPVQSTGLTRVVHCKYEPYDVYIGRRSDGQGIWGNSYSEKTGTLAKFKVMSRGEAIRRHREDVLADPKMVEKIKRELTGKVLGCWCKFPDNPLPCHGDTYAAICNGDLCSKEPVKQLTQTHTILIDGNNLAMRNIMASALDDLKAGGIFTGGIYGSLLSLTSILKQPEISPGRIFAFFDAGVPAHRMALVPYYKEPRVEKKKLLTDEQKERAMTQLQGVAELFEFLGVTCLSYGNREADDCIAAACRLANNPVIVSSDADLRQCIDHKPSTMVWDIGQKRFITSENFQEVTKVHPNVSLLHKMLIGDVSDNLKGGLGTGEVRATELMERVWTGIVGLKPQEQFNFVCEYLQSLTKRETWEDAILTGRCRLVRELAAIDLTDSFGSSESLRERMIETPKPDWHGFMRKCQSLHFNSVLGDPLKYLDPYKKAFARVTDYQK